MAPTGGGGAVRGACGSGFGVAVVVVVAGVVDNLVVPTQTAAAVPARHHHHSRRERHGDVCEKLVGQSIDRAGAGRGRALVVRTNGFLRPLYEPQRLSVFTHCVASVRTVGVTTGSARSKLSVRATAGVAGVCGAGVYTAYSSTAIRDTWVRHRGSSLFGDARVSSPIHDREGRRMWECALGNVPIGERVEAYG
jgi:hypothetical protein